ncbi:MAG: hypothetical protein OXT69_09290 [Candidatus Poribacteria bacterium]|nr:hypothetical protein [Candidatus Poribacteria bacterium]
MAVTLIKTRNSKGDPIDLSQQPDAGVQILVEGGDDSRILKALIDHMAGAISDRQEIEDVNIYELGGKPSLKRFLPVLVKSEGFEQVKRIGILLDADDSEERAFQSVQSALKNAGLPVPHEPNAPAEADGRPSVTALILPGGGRAGELETLLCESFKDDPVNQCVDEFFECVERLNGAVEQPEKARVRTYIAAQTDPNVAAGGAAERGYWNFEHNAFQPIRRFMSLVVWGGEPQHPV